MKTNTKKSTLEKLQEASGNAVKLITDTLDNLKHTNEQIESEKEIIKNTIAKLQTEDNSLSELSNKNARIISNFEALLK